MSIFSFTTNPTILIHFNNQENKLYKKVRLQQGQPVLQDIIVYSGIDNIQGTVEITVPNGKKLEHLGIKIELIGQIEPSYDRGNNIKFLSLVRELDVPGILSSSSASLHSSSSSAAAVASASSGGGQIINQSSSNYNNANAIMNNSNTYPFEFSTEKPYDSYHGLNIQLRYFLRVTITRNYGNNIIKERDFFIQNYQVMNVNNSINSSSSSTINTTASSSSSSSLLPSSQNNTAATTAAAAIISTQPSLNNPLHPTTPSSSSSSSSSPTIKMEVGIEDCLHIEFEYDKSKYHLNDIILGKIHFLLVRIKIKFMELAIIRRESCGNGANIYNESENILKYELMDGVPVKGENIPIRLYLSSFDLTPTYRSVHNIFSIKYYLNLVLVDEEDRRYFKQQEVVFYRQQSNNEEDE